MLKIPKPNKLIAIRTDELRSILKDFDTKNDLSAHEIVFVNGVHLLIQR